MELDNIKSYALILIYSDGLIDKIKMDNRKFHMEYFMDLNTKSTKFSEILKRRQVYIPDSDEAKYMITYEIDDKLAEEGVIIIHNLFLDGDVSGELDDYSCDYYFSMPKELTDVQKNIMHNIFDNYDMTTSWFATFNGMDPIDITYEDVMKMMNNKTK